MYRLPIDETHANADAMSRMPLEGASVEPQTTPELVLMFENLQDAPITARQIAHWTERDLSCPECVGTSEKGDRRLTTMRS